MFRLARSALLRRKDLCVAERKMHGWLGQISGLMQGQQEDAQEYLTSLLRLLALEQAD